VLPKFPVQFTYAAGKMVNNIIFGGGSTHFSGWSLTCCQFNGWVAHLTGWNDFDFFPFSMTIIQMRIYKKWIFKYQKNRIAMQYSKISRDWLGLLSYTDRAAVGHPLAGPVQGFSWDWWLTEFPRYSVMAVISRQVQFVRFSPLFQTEDSRAGVHRLGTWRHHSIPHSQDTALLADRGVSVELVAMCRLLLKMKQTCDERASERSSSS